MRMNAWCAGAASLALMTGGVGGFAWADDPPKDPLGGPTVTTTPRPATIVERDMAGKLVRLDTRPEIAAVGKLTLTDEEKQKVEKVVMERAAAVTKFLYDSLDLFLEIQNARQAGDRAGAEPLIRKFRPLAEGLLTPPLTERLASVLPAEKGADLKRLVTEYNEAVAAEEAAGGGREGGREGKGEEGAKGPAGRGAINPARQAMRTEINNLLREMARTLAGVVNERRERTEFILKSAEATPEQEAAIRKIIRDVGEQSRGKTPTTEQRAELMRKIMEALTPEQRRKLSSALREQNG